MGNTEVISRRGGLFKQPRRTSEVTHPIFGSFLIRVTGSRSIVLRAAFFGDKGTPLAIPVKGKRQQGITLSCSASGGQVQEEVWGWKARRGLEYSVSEYWAMAIARAVFYQVYLRYHLMTPTGDTKYGSSTYTIEGSIPTREGAQMLVDSILEAEPGREVWIESFPDGMFAVRGYAIESVTAPARIDWDELMEAISNPQ